MTHNAGFTLLELLVVVLIIGILAAVAVPQYQQAVEKARAMQMLTLTRSLGQALDMYYQANGTAPSSFDELDVELPADWTGNQKIYHYMTVDVRSNADWSTVIEHSSTGRLAVHIGRLTGNYKGAEFSYYANKGNLTVAEHQPLCGEVIENGIVFKKNPGDFCVKFFKGVQIHNAGIRLYEMP